MSIRANLNRLEPQIEELQNKINNLESCLIVSNVRVNEEEKNGEQLEHQNLMIIPCGYNRKEKC